MEKLKGAARAPACTLVHPFVAFSFLPLPVIPELKPVDFGQADVSELRIIPFEA